MNKSVKSSQRLKLRNALKKKQKEKIGNTSTAKPGQGKHKSNLTIASFRESIVNTL